MLIFLYTSDKLLEPGIKSELVKLNLYTNTIINLV